MGGELRTPPPITGRRNRGKPAAERGYYGRSTTSKTSCWQLTPAINQTASSKPNTERSLTVAADTAPTGVGKRTLTRPSGSAMPKAPAGAPGQTGQQPLQLYRATPRSSIWVGHVADRGLYQVPVQP